MSNAFHPGRATYVEIEGMEHGLTIREKFAQRLGDETLRFFNDHAR